MKRSNPNKKCPYSPHLGPVGCLPAPNIFPLAKETFAKGKMFLNLMGTIIPGLIIVVFFYTKRYF